MATIKQLHAFRDKHLGSDYPLQGNKQKQLRQVLSGLEAPVRHWSIIGVDDHRIKQAKALRDNLIQDLIDLGFEIHNNQ